MSARRGRAPRPAVLSPPSAADMEAFRLAMIDVQPLYADRVHHEPPPPLPIPRQRQREHRETLAESLYGPALVDLYLEGGDEAAWARNGVPATVLRDLRRGRWVVQGKLDLHGHNREEARLALAAFLQDATRAGLRCVRVVHGKGLSSPGREPVLKRLVLGWLSQRSEVMAFCQARAAEGGAGAAIVLLGAGKYR